MASTINANPGSTTQPTALIKTADSSGALTLQTKSTNALTIDSFQNITANYTGTTTGSPTVTTNGSNTVMKFTSSGSYTA